MAAKADPNAAKAAPKAAPAEEKKEVKEVHELAFYEGKGWGVKRQGSEKIIKYFKTSINKKSIIFKWKNQ